VTDRRLESGERTGLAFGRLGGWLFVLGAMFTLPTAPLIDPAPEPVGYAVVLAALLCGVVSLLLPWDRLGTPALHAVILFGQLEIALAAVTFDWYAVFFYLLLAVYVGYALADRRDVIAELALSSVAVVAVAVHEPGMVDERLRMAVFEIPIVWLCAGMVVYLRERLTENARSYEQLAGETALIAERIHRAGARLTERRIAAR
jgi:signal transduction histidine kinase